MKTFFTAILLTIITVLHGQTTPPKVDSTRLESFVLTREYLTQEVPIDTSLISSAQFNPIKNKSLPLFYLGNLGTPWLNSCLSDRPYGNDFIYASYFSSYFALPQNRTYFNTKRPYTYIYYTSGGSKQTFEQAIEIFHTQNIRKNWNFGFKVQNFSSAGVYADQRTRLYAVSLFSSYEASYYSIYGQVNYNSAQYNENGGLINELALKRLNDNTETAVDLPVSLTTASSKIKNLSFRIDQVLKNIPNNSLSSSGLVKLGHTLEISSYKRNYKDNTKTGIDTSFYANTYSIKNVSNDSVVFQDINNTLSLSLGAVNLWASPSLRVYIGNQLGRWSNSLPYDTVVYTEGITVNNGKLSKDIYNNWIGASFTGVSTSFVWDFDAKSYWTGSRQGDFELKFKLRFGDNNWKYLPGLVVEGWQKRTAASWMLSNLYSNHFIWKNTLAPTNETTVKGALLLNVLRTNVTAQLSRFDHYIIFDENAFPVASSAFQYFVFKAENNLSFWKFKTQNYGFFQTVSKKDIVNLPQFGLSHSLWFDYNLHFNITGGDLNMNIGYQIQAFSKFYADAYMPATGIFYNQTNSKIGNYPYVDLFAIFQVKRTQFFLRYDHVNEGFSGRTYFSSYLYPMPGRMFKFGVRWYLAD